MSESIAAVYENGVFRPLHPVNLSDGERVQLTVEADERAIDPAANLPSIAKDTGITDLATNIDYANQG